jgi:hypothetical protein
MPCHQVCLAAVRRQDTLQTLPFRRLGGLATVLLACALAQGCTGDLKSLGAGPDPSDPNVRAPAVRYRSTIGAYVSRRPVEPSSWRERNEQVSPQTNP